VQAGSGVETYVAANPLAIEAWQHVAFAKEGSAVRLYVDGALAGSKVVQEFPAAAAMTRAWIGRGSGAVPLLQAAVDDFRIYGRALTGAEIALLAAGP